MKYYRKSKLLTIIVRVILYTPLILIAGTLLVVFVTLLYKHITRPEHLRYQEGEFVVVTKNKLRTLPFNDSDKNKSRTVSTSVVYTDKWRVGYLKELISDNQVIAPCFCTPKDEVALYKDGKIQESIKIDHHDGTWRLQGKVAFFMPKEGSAFKCLTFAVDFDTDLDSLRGKLLPHSFLIMPKNAMIPVCIRRNVSDSTIKQNIERLLQIYVHTNNVDLKWEIKSGYELYLSHCPEDLLGLLKQQKYIVDVMPYFPKNRNIRVYTADSTLFKKAPEHRKVGGKYAAFTIRFSGGGFLFHSYEMGWVDLLQYRWSVCNFLQTAVVRDSLYPDSLCRQNEMILRHLDDYDRFLNSNNRITDRQKQKMSDLFLYVKGFTSDDSLLREPNNDTLQEKAQSVLDAFHWINTVPPRDELIFNPKLADEIKTELGL